MEIVACVLNLWPSWLAPTLPPTVWVLNCFSIKAVQFTMWALKGLPCLPLCGFWTVCFSFKAVQFTGWALKGLPCLLFLDLCWNFWTLVVVHGSCPRALQRLDCHLILCLRWWWLWNDWISSVLCLFEMVMTVEWLLSVLCQPEMVITGQGMIEYHQSFACLRWWLIVHVWNTALSNPPSISDGHHS